MAPSYAPFFLLVVFGALVIVALIIWDNVQRRTELPGPKMFLTVLGALAVGGLIGFGAKEGIGLTGTIPAEGPALLMLFPALGGLAAIAAAHRDKDRGFVWPHRLDPQRPVYDIGFLGDFLVGCFGAIAIMLIVPGAPSFFTTWDKMRALALAVIGGYGARAVLDAALKTRLAQAEKTAATAREEAAELARRRARADAAKRAVQSHLEGTERRTEAEFEALFRDLPADGPGELFRLADEKRSGWRRVGRSDEIAAVLPVFIALERIDTTIPPAELQAAIAMTYFDKTPPEFDKALARIDRAIALAKETPRKYLIIRAVSLALLAAEGKAEVGEAAAALKELSAVGGWIENAEYRKKVNAFADAHKLGISIPDKRPG